MVDDLIDSCELASEGAYTSVGTYDSAELVAKLYPDAELPVFSFDDTDPQHFVLNYESSRGFADLAQGLIEETMQHYGEDFTIERTDSEQGDKHLCRFVLSAA
jgi:hypothetical protein